MGADLHEPPHTVPDPAAPTLQPSLTAEPAELAARWPMLDLRPVRLNGLRGSPGEASTYTVSTYTVLDSRGLRVVGEILGRDDGRFTARATGGAPEGVFNTVAAALEALSQTTRAEYM
ncbi:hypothetical protein ACX8Z9_12515 [Arthrobacter halodurans]|uniref:Uncharacterized protein n=1 Tax=Arthrobacter halodurans TaxID=516699 RepID=A0ABV4UN61_9MICC